MHPDASCSHITPAPLSATPHTPARALTRVTPSPPRRAGTRAPPAPPARARSQCCPPARRTRASRTWTRTLSQSRARRSRACAGQGLRDPPPSPLPHRPSGRKGRGAPRPQASPRCPSAAPSAHPAGCRRRPPQRRWHTGTRRAARRGGGTQRAPGGREWSGCESGCEDGCESGCEVTLGRLGIWISDRPRRFLLCLALLACLGHAPSPTGRLTRPLHAGVRPQAASPSLTAPHACLAAPVASSGSD
jgi:hypothetical protein